MQPIIQELVEHAIKSDGTDLSILQLMLIVERSNRPDKEHPDFRTHLSKEQLKINLTIEEQGELVEKLLSAVHIAPQGTSLLWIIGKSSPRVLVKQFQSYFLSYYREMDDNSLYQSLISLGNIFVTIDTDDYVASHFDVEGIVKLLENLLDCSKDDRVLEQVQNVKLAVDWLKDR